MRCLPRGARTTFLGLVTLSILFTTLLYANNNNRDNSDIADNNNNNNNNNNGADSPRQEAADVYNDQKQESKNRRVPTSFKYDDEANYKDIKKVTLETTTLADSEEDDNNEGVNNINNHQPAEGDEYEVVDGGGVNSKKEGYGDGDVENQNDGGVADDGIVGNEVAATENDQGKLERIQCIVNGRVLAATSPTREGDSKKGGPRRGRGPENELIEEGDESDGACYKDKETTEVYLPFFTFIKPYFEITGQLEQQKDGREAFIWWHNSSRITQPALDEYHPRGPFGPFGSYNVEARERVRCVHGVYGPPSQIKLLSNQMWRVIREKDAKATTSSASNLYKFTRSGGVMIDTPTKLKSAGVSLELYDGPFHFLNFPIRLFPSTIITVTVFVIEMERIFTLHYIQSKDTCVTVSKGAQNTFLYGLGDTQNGSTRDTRFIRNILIDVSKGIALQHGYKKKKGRTKVLNAESLRLVRLTVRGQAEVLGSVQQQNTAHAEQFLLAADWLLAHQTETGGWSVPVKRTLAKDRLQLQPGWYSAMAQGHALSLLTRAFIATKQSKYIQAAQKALSLFEKSAAVGGVQNKFLDRVPWYEEYPTTPGSFVLNGFIYSLLGLYDYQIISKDSRAKELYHAGVASLKTLLPLYDSGSGSHYDLRHFSLPGVPPNLARWDYHTLHVYQLLWMFRIERDPLFKTTAERWIQYALGKRAKHN